MTTKVRILAVTILLLGAAALNAEEKKEWLQSGSFTERTENWTQRSSSLRSTQEDNTPPTEPWGDAPIGDGLWYIVSVAGIYAMVKLGLKRKSCHKV
jgi:hypothetical protein